VPITPGQSVAHLLAAADRACYLAKEKAGAASGLPVPPALLDHPLQVGAEGPAVQEPGQLVVGRLVRQLEGEEALVLLLGRQRPDLLLVGARRLRQEVPEDGVVELGCIERVGRGGRGGGSQSGLRDRFGSSGISGSSRRRTRMAVWL